MENGEHSNNMERGEGLYLADLFAGAGGLTEGFRQASFTPVAAVEFDRWAARTVRREFRRTRTCMPYRTSRGQSADGEVLWSGTSVDGNPTSFETHAIDVLVGGPPCQGFSPLGRMNDWDFDDPRNKLWKHYVRLLDVLRPKLFVIENVPEILKSAEFDRFKRHVKRLDHGYDMTFAVLNAAFMGCRRHGNAQLS